MKMLSAILFSCVLLLSSCGKDEEKAPEPAITDMNTIVSAGDRRALVGREVNLDNVPVDSIVGNYVFWAGNEHSAIPVFRKDKYENKETTPVPKGGNVRIQGTIRLVENVGAADPLWDLVNEEEKQDIANAKVYIEAAAVQNIQ